MLVLRGVGAADSPCHRLAAPVFRPCPNEQTSVEWRALFVQTRKPASNKQCSDSPARLFVQTPSCPSSAGLLCPLCRFWPTDGPESSVVPKRPLNLQIWTADGTDASVVHICTLQTGAPPLKQGQRPIRTPEATHPTPRRLVHNASWRPGREGRARRCSPPRAGQVERSLGYSSSASVSMSVSTSGASPGATSAAA